MYQYMIASTLIMIKRATVHIAMIINKDRYLPRSSDKAPKINNIPIIICMIPIFEVSNLY